MVLYSFKVLDVHTRSPITKMPRVRLFRYLADAGSDDVIKKLDPEKMQDAIIGNIALDL